MSSAPGDRPGAATRPIDALREAGVEVHPSAVGGVLAPEQLPPRLPRSSSRAGRAAALARGAVRAAARSGVGTRLMKMALNDPTVLQRVEVHLSDRQASRASFARSMPADPAEMEGGFAGCAWLLDANHLNHGLARLRLDEAAYLYRLTASLGAPRAVEIGRFQGGTTFLLAHAGAEVLSVDLDVEAQAVRAAALAEALTRAGLRERVTLVVADSRAYPAAEGAYDLLFVDGDHSRDGVLADVQNWWPALRSGGHALFHDATRQFPWVTGVADALEEIVRRPDVAEVRPARGTLVHLVKA